MSSDVVDAHRSPRPRGHYRAWRRIATRWSDNDAYGHVNNVVHYGWFDTAVNAWLIDAGLLDIAGGDTLGLVVETGCRYLAPLSFPQSIDVGLAVEKVGNSSVRYNLGVFPENEPQPAAEGFFVHVHVDRAGRKPVPLPPHWRAKLAAIAA